VQSLRGQPWRSAETGSCGQLAPKHPSERPRLDEWWHCRVNVVFAVNEGVVYMSANVPDHRHQADFVLSVDRDAQGRYEGVGSILEPGR
jgi:hypothetical protein